LLLDVLRLCVTLFEYCGRVPKSFQYPAAPRPKAQQQEMKAKLEEMMLGNKGAAKEMMQRHSRVMHGNVILYVPQHITGNTKQVLRYGLSPSP